MIKTYDTLYAKANTGKTLIWFVEQHNNAYRTTSGQVDGKKVTTDWTLCSAKNVSRANETTGIEQAVSEIDALYTKRLKQKYRRDIEDIDTPLFFQPTLAKKYSDYESKVNFFDGSWLAQNKFNGCVHGDSIVETLEFGPMSISYIVENNIQCQVMSWNETLEHAEYKKVLNYFKDKEVDTSPVWYEIETESGRKIKATGNHRVFLPELKCWRRVDELDGSENLMVNLH